MPQSIVLGMKGEHTYASDLSGVPQGSLALGLNININRDGIAEPRRGYDVLASLPSGSDRAARLFFWNGETFVHYGTTFSHYASSVFTSLGALSIPTNATSIRAVKSQNKNLYVTGSTGVSKLDSTTGSLTLAGVIKGLNIDLAVAGAGTAVANNQYVTYRYLLGRKDANSNISKGGVSGRFTIQNTAGSTQNITATCYIPSTVDTTYFLQLYRSPAAATSATFDEQLCYEVPVASADVSNGYVTVTDVYTDPLLGATIYTASTQETATQDSARPPLARDIAEYKGFMFYADIDQPHRFIFTLISAGASPGLVNTDTIVLKLGATTETYTGAATEDTSVKQFKVYTAGSAAQNIDNTIKSFIKCVNKGSSVLYAFNLAEDANALPGKCLLEARSIASTSFTVVCAARSTAFIPQLPSPATVNNTSTQDSFPNGVMWSKQNQPEAVPLANINKIGSSDDRIKRVVALRDAVLFFKERDGVYVMTGDDPAHFYFRLLDSTAKLVAPDTIDVINNFAYGLFAAGICEVSPDGGVNIVSIPIKDQLLPLYGTPLTALKAYSFGFGSDVDGKYILAVPQTSADTYATKQHVYDVNGKTFVRWDLALTCGAVDPVTTKIYLGSGNANTVKTERKASDYTDYGDYKATCTVSSYSTTTLHIDNTAGMAAGDILVQGTTALAYIESVDSPNGVVVIDTTQAWTVGVATVTHYAAISCKVQWNPDCAQNPGGLKHYSECALLAKQAFQKSATLYFSSDVNPGETSISIASAAGNGAFGASDFGDGVFGGEQAKAPKRLGVPRQVARCNSLSVRFENKIAYSDFQIEGLALDFNPTSTRTTR